jgi:hypothetical protein
MKKCIAMLLVFLFVLSFASCSHQDASEYIVEENGLQYLILPESGERVLVYPDDEVYLDDIDLEMLKNAEPILKEKTEPYKEYGEPTYGFRFEDGRLYLLAQVYTEPAGWCGNRNYEVFQEPISRVVRN